MVRMKRRLSLVIQGETDPAIAAGVTAVGSAGISPGMVSHCGAHPTAAYVLWSENMGSSHSSHTGNPSKWFN